MLLERHRTDKKKRELEAGNTFFFCHWTDGRAMNFGKRDFEKSCFFGS